jgi:release factor glutamine methyltransferase
VSTLGALLREGVERLTAAASPSPRLDTELLLGHAIGIDRSGVVAHPDAPVGADAEATFRAGLERRAAGEPVAYIRGIKEFYGVALTADPRALIPRPETERLVELAEQVFEMPVRLGAPQGLGGLSANVADPRFSTGVGLVMRAAQSENPDPRERRVSPIKLPGFDLRRWFSDLF